MHTHRGEGIGMAELDRSLSQKRLTRRTALRLAGVGGMGAIVASCFPGGTPSQPQGAPSLILPPETLTIAQPADAVRIVPLPSSLLTTFSTTSNIYESLYHFKRPPAYPEAEPMLATRWESINPTTWRFHLRQGVKFHNGTEFTADSVLFTLDNIRKTPSAGRIQPIDRIVPVDKYTVDIITKNPWFLILYQFNNTFMVEDRGWSTSSDFDQAKGIGTGPYKFVEWIKGDRVVMERNEDWWGGPKPPFKRLVWRAIPEASTRVSALLAGEVDLIRDVQPQDAPRINARDGLVAKTVPANGITYARIRNDGIYANQSFRQALNYALDRDAIISGAMGGYGARTNGNRDPRMLGVDPNLGDYPYDPAKAMQLIKDSGYNGQKVVIEQSKGVSFKDAEIAQAMGGFYEKVGLNVEVKLLEQGAYEAKRQDPKVAADGIMIQTTGNALPDFENVLNDMTDPDTGAERQLIDPRLLEIRLILQRTVDVSERIKLAREGAARVKDQALIILIANLVIGWGMKKWLDWEPRSDQHIWVREMKFRG
jgi:peptide/nickel transport system substrate-binding protein